MKFLITFALDMEFGPWRRVRTFAKVSQGDFSLYEANFGEAQVRIALTGVGGVRATNVTRAALEQWQPDVCIAAGLAGSLRHEHRVGQICVPRDIMDLETGRTVLGDASLMRQAEKCGAVLIERLLTSSTMVLTAEGKSRLGKMAEAVEMESFAVASEAAAKGIPAIAIRAISDAADEDLPMNFAELLDETGNVSRSKAARALARAPQRLAAVMRLARQSRAAAANLANFLDRYVSVLATRNDLRANEVAEAKRG